MCQPHYIPVATPHRYMYFLQIIVQYTKYYAKKSFQVFNNLHVQYQNFCQLKYVTPTFFFIRAQKQYNKRRYTRMKPTSRASFWAGLSLSTICAYMCWPSTIQFTDWGLVTPVICDIYLPFIGFYFMLIHKIIFNCYRPWIHAISNKSVIQNGFKKVLQKSSLINWKWFC